MIKFKKGDKINLSNTPKVKLGEYKIVWEPDEQSTPKDSVTTDYSECIKEDKK